MDIYILIRIFTIMILILIVYLRRYQRHRPHLVLHDA